MTDWPRKIAREYPDIRVAVGQLLLDMDEHNQQFAVEEFTRERVRLALHAKPFICSEMTVAEQPK